ncbi:MAG TPA: ABC transporter ATP-binding protein [Candidatus Saccharimonadales bacterium]|nr:ABC transporter ATP-binding protein [Candidatus Saccharimonadales bacterium]
MFFKNSFVRLLAFTVPHKRSILLASFYSAFNKVCDIIPEILMSVAIDVVVNQEKSKVAQWGIINPVHQLYLVASLTAMFWILEAIFEYLYYVTWRQVAQDVQHDIRLQTYQTMQGLDLEYFETKTTGGLLTVVQDDITQIETFLSQTPNELIQLMINSIGLGLVFLYISPKVFLLTLMPIPLVIYIAYYFQHKLSILYEKLRLAAGNIAKQTVYRLQAITAIKSYTAEQYELKRLRNESNYFKKTFCDTSSVTALYIPLVRLAIMVGFITAMIVGGKLILTGDIPISLYAILMFLMQRFLWPFTNVSHIVDSYERTVAASNRVIHILHSKPKIISGTESFSVKDMKGEVTFSNVGFRYPNGVEVFNDLSFNIPAQTTVGFVGTTGSGKSTIVQLLLRFYDVQKGTISIDGHNIKNMKLEDLRESITFVSQNVYMVDGTIQDNIAYGTFQASQDDIMRAAQMAQAHDFIMEMPHGYQTVLQEYGKNLSGGQKQRLSIARALLKNSRILVFDEATSALDNETEGLISQSMDRLRNDHTIIIIAHRLSTVRQADIIFVLDNGQIVESGSHDELLQKNGVYAQLWNI